MTAARRRIALLAIVCASACGGQRSQSAPALPAHASTPEAWGIAPVSLRPTFGGTMLDFRFKVVDAEKARPLFDRKVKPYLFDPKSGVALGMPDDTKLGALRAGLRNPPIVGKLYYVLFSNGYETVKRGSKVHVVIGDCKLENVRVD